MTPKEVESSDWSNPYSSEEEDTIFYDPNFIFPQPIRLPYIGVSKTLFAGNLALNVQRSDIEEFFKEAGEVVDVRLAVYDGVFKSFAHVEFASFEAAEKAMEFYGRLLLGRAIRLDECPESPRSKGLCRSVSGPR